VWQGDDALKAPEELSVQQIGEVFSDPLFRKLRRINIQGGEATLRDDIAAVTEVIIERLPRLSAVSLTSNGLDTVRVCRAVEQMHVACRNHGLPLHVCLSIDGVGPYHDYARGKDAFRRVTETIARLREHFDNRSGFFLGTNCVLTAHNIHDLDEILAFQQATFGTTNLSVVEFREHFLNDPGCDAAKRLLFTENPKERDMLVSYLKEHNRPTAFSDFMAFRHEQLRAMLEDGKPRTQSCQYKISGAVLDHRGDLMVCPVAGKLAKQPGKTYRATRFSRTARATVREMSRSVCRTCYPYNFYAVERDKDFVKYLKFFLQQRRSVS